MAGLFGQIWLGRLNLAVFFVGLLFEAFISNIAKAPQTQALTQFGVRAKSYFHLRHAMYLAHETSIVFFELEMIADFN